MNFNFDLKNTAVLWAIKQEKFPLFRFANFLKKVFFVLFIISLVLSGFYFMDILSFSLETMLKINTLFLVAFLFFWEVNLFLNLKIRNPETEINLATVISEPQNYNLADFLGLEAAKIMRAAINFCEKRKIGEISSTVLLYSSIKESSKRMFGINYVDTEDMKELEIIGSESVGEEPEKFSVLIGRGVVYGVKGDKCKEEIEKMVKEAAKIMGGSAGGRDNEFKGGGPLKDKGKEAFEKVKLIF